MRSSFRESAFARHSSNKFGFALAYSQIFVTKWHSLSTIKDLRNLSYVITGIDGNREVFVNFYKTRGVSSEARLTRSEEARAQTNNTPSTGKVTQNSPTDQTNPQQSATEQGTDRYSHNNKDKKIPPSQEARDNLVLTLPQAVLFEVLSISLQTPKESPSTLQRYEKMPKVQSTGRPIDKNR